MIKDKNKLVTLIKNEQSGKGGNFEEICNIAAPVIEGLVRPVIDNEDEEDITRIVKKILVKMYGKIKNIDLNDVEKWIKCFTSVSVYEILSDMGENLFASKNGYADYEYNSIESDTKLLAFAKNNNAAFEDKDKFIYLKETFEQLSSGQVILYEMFCYEGISLTQISTLLDIDLDIIKSEIAVLKSALIGEAVNMTNKTNKTSKSSQEEDIDEIKNALASIVKKTVSEATSSDESYEDIVAEINSFTGNANRNKLDDIPQEIEGDVLAETVMLDVEQINKAVEAETRETELEANIELTGTIPEAVKISSDDSANVSNAQLKQNDKFNDESDDEFDDDYDDEFDDDYDGESDNKDSEDYDDSEEDDDEEDDRDSRREKKALYGKTGKSATRKTAKCTRAGGTDKLLKILAIAAPTVAVVIFVIILVTGGSSSKSTTANSNKTTAAVTQSTTAVQSTTKAQSTTAASKTNTDKTTAADKTKEEVTTTAANKSDNNNNSGNNNSANNTVNNNSDNNNTDNNTDNNNTDNSNIDNNNTDNSNTDNSNTDNSNTDNNNTDNSNTDNNNSNSDKSNEATTAAPVEATTAAPVEATTETPTKAPTEAQTEATSNQSAIK